MIILGIETSCDETSVALVEDGKRVLSGVTASSVQEQAKYGGVFPEVAARRQLEFIMEVIKQAVGEEKFDAIAVTRGPGLLTSLLVGTTAARTLASIWKKSLIGVHHTLGHLSSPWIECQPERHPERSQNEAKRSFGGVEGRRLTRLENDIRFPILALSVSGGHSEIWLRESHTKGKLIGRTRDDAAGEAFDKGAALLGLPYPGGPAISKSAEGGNPHYIEFPRPLAGEKTFGFSFSGLKTSLKYAIRDRGGIDALSEAEKKDVAASFQETVCRHLVDQICRALEVHDVRELHVVGGVAANGRLRSMLKERCGDIKIRIPPLKYCTDNAAMIAAAGYFMIQELGEGAHEGFETEASVSLGV